MIRLNRGEGFDSRRTFIITEEGKSKIEHCPVGDPKTRVLTIMLCSDESLDIEDIARLARVSKKQAEQSLKTLHKHGFVDVSGSEEERGIE